jgi:hypothetical protein
MELNGTPEKDSFPCLLSIPENVALVEHSIRRFLPRGPKWPHLAPWDKDVCGRMSRNVAECRTRKRYYMGRETRATEDSTA